MALGWAACGRGGVGRAPPSACFFHGEASRCCGAARYIAVLQEALRVKVGELGLGGHAELLTQMAQLRGQSESAQRELAEKEKQACCVLC